MNINKNSQKQNPILALFAMLCIAFASCTNYNDNGIEPQIANYSLALTIPLNINGATLTQATAVLTNVETGKQYTATNFKPAGKEFETIVSVPEGNYNIAVKGTINYKLNNQNIAAKVKAECQNIAISAAETQKTTQIALNVYSAQEGFVISEIFFTGTTTPDGFMYTDDQYIKIGNNSDTTMYADGIAFIESFFTSDDKHDYQPDIRNEAMTISAIYVIPGTGHDVPVLPGKELLIALTAIDHRPINPNSFDLRKADFEIYDKSSHPEGDQDNPKVPNLLNWYANFNGTFVMHTRGVKSYALARPMVDQSTYTKQYRYKFGYIFKKGDIVVPMNENEYFMPNAWIIDAVNLAVPTVYEWNIISARLDKGFTYCGNVDFDEARYNKAVVRKRNENGWIDTNNSTNDFTPNAVPSCSKLP